MSSCIPPLINQLISLPWAARIVAAMGLGSLAFALIMQFGFGYEPCILCLYQRVPYGLTAALGLTLATCPPARRHAVWLFALCSTAYLAGMGLAIFHTGVEQHWWLGTSGCAVTPLASHNIDDLRDALLHATSVPCDEVTWTLFGLSMANWNIPLSLGLAVFAALAATQNADKQPSSR